MAYHLRPEDDPYITQHDDSDSEKDDFVLKGTDRLILAARNEDDVSHLEVSVVNSSESAACVVRREQNHMWWPHQG
jgi:periodic tryptophan protein 1